MKHAMKFIVMAVAVCVLFCLTLPAMAATNTEGVTFTATINTPTIEVSDQDQTVELTIKTNKEVVYDSYEADVYLPTGFAVKEMKNTMTTFVEGTDYFDTLIVYCTSNAKNLTTDTLLTITYTIPANTPAGEYDLGVYFWIIGRDFCMDVWEEGADVTATLTIKEAAPACEHEYKYDCDKVCAKCGEETRPEAEHKYANPCDAHCMFCHELTNEEEPAHNVIHVEAVDATCTENGNIEYWYCDICGSAWADEERTQVTNLKAVVLPMGHGDIIAVEAKDATCTEDGNIAYWYCADCGQAWLDAECTLNTNLKAVVLPARGSHGITKGFRYVYNGNGTHTQYCNDCDEAIERNTNVKCSDRENDGNHLCDFCFAEENMVTPHTGGNATCSSWAVCEECSAAYGELDKDEHEPGKGSYYRNNGEDHTFVCSCGADIRNEAHDYTYDAESHKCVCGDVEKFTLTVNVLATGETVELTVPYGANLLEVLAKAAEEHKIPAIGDQLRVNDRYFNGYYITSGYNYYDSEEDCNVTISEDMTMPGEDFDVEQDLCIFGWVYYYDEYNDNYVGAEYYDEDGFWLGSGEPGWYYIEENFDDVEGGAWYYFYKGTGSWEGFTFRTEGLSRVPYPTAPINGKTYAPNAEDLAYAGFIDATEAWFVFGEDGKFQFDMTEIMDGKYVENGMIAWHPGFVKVEGVWYYFVGDIENGGNKAAQGLIYVTRNADAAGFVKRDRVWFADGKVDTTKSGVIDGYYYEKGKLMVGAGLIKIGEDIYYVRSSGKVATGKYYITKSNDLAGFATGMKLYFDENGKMLPVKSGVVDGYYYENGRIVYGAGLIKINGDVYYVCSSGKVATGEYYITKTNGMDGFNAGDKLTFGEDGKLLPVKSGVVDGYYYENGRIAYGAGLIKIDGDIYYVRSNGEVATGKYWVTNTNGLLEAGEYNFGTDGKLITE